jgi:hypothetical protein
LVSELVRCGIARDDRVERVLRGPPAGVSGLGSCRGIAGVHDDPVDPWPQSISFWEGVSESPEAQERLLNGIVNFRGVTEEERGCAVRGRVPLLQEFLELARIGVGSHVSKTLRHCRRFDFSPEQGRHHSTGADRVVLQPECELEPTGQRRGRRQSEYRIVLAIMPFPANPMDT